MHLVYLKLASRTLGTFLATPGYRLKVPHSTPMVLSIYSLLGNYGRKQTRVTQAVMAVIIQDSCGQVKLNLCRK
jgi:hypothetical protein